MNIITSIDSIASNQLQLQALATLANINAANQTQQELKDRALASIEEIAFRSKSIPRKVTKSKDVEELNNSFDSDNCSTHSIICPMPAPTRRKLSVTSRPANWKVLKKFGNGLFSVRSPFSSSKKRPVANIHSSGSAGSSNMSGSSSQILSPDSSKDDSFVSEWVDCCCIGNEEYPHTKCIGTDVKNSELFCSVTNKKVNSWCRKITNTSRHHVLDVPQYYTYLT